MFLLFSFLSFSRYFSCFYLFIYCCLVHTVHHTMLRILSLPLQKHMGLNYYFFNLQYSFSLSFFLPSILPFFLPSLLPSFFPFFLSLIEARFFTRGLFLRKKERKKYIIMIYASSVKDFVLSLERFLVVVGFFF